MLERRLTAEWNLLLALVQKNPGRLQHPTACDTTFFITLHPVSAETTNGGATPWLPSHDIRIEYPVHFPAVPMELYLSTPVLHPNVHPQTGFVCLWDRHRVSNTVEHALHKTVAMLAGRLYNPEPLHVMQPLALSRLAQLSSEPPPQHEDGSSLQGVDYAAPWLDHLHSTPGRRIRLS